MVVLVGYVEEDVVAGCYFLGSGDGMILYIYLFDVMGQY